MYDLLIQNGLIVDGTGDVPYPADVAVKGDTIVKIGEIREPATRTIDARGRLVTPGFIDIHCHSDAIVFQPDKNPTRLRQGFTTEVVGNCGISCAPLTDELRERWAAYCAPFFSEMEVPYSWNSYDQYLAEVEKNRLCLNMAGLVGHGTVRACVAGFEDRPFTPEELARAQALLADSLQAGAFGFSSGLIYPPGVYSTREEMLALARVVQQHGAIYTSHIRSESYGLIEAVGEAIRVAEETGASVEISHHKAAGRPNHGKIRETLGMIAEARAKGLNVNCDVYPYDAASTNFNSILPPWALAGGVEAMLERLRSPETRAKLIAAMKDQHPDWESFYQLTGWEGMYITECSVEKYADRTLAEIARTEGVDPFEKALDILLESRNHTMMIVFFMSPEDVSRAIASPFSIICTDGFPSRKKSHPRYYGSCVRVLEKYVKEEHLLSLPQAVHKMTGMPAAKLGIADRGQLREGMKADLLVIDFAALHDNATYQNDTALCDGIDYVAVNGQVVVEEGKNLPIYAGRVLRKGR